MASLTIRNVLDEVHRTLRVRAARHGRSTEAEIRDILEMATRSPDRVKLGSMLAGIGREAGLTEADCALFERQRASGPNESDRHHHG